MHVQKGRRRTSLITWKGKERLRWRAHCSSSWCGCLINYMLISMCNKGFGNLAFSSKRDNISSFLLPSVNTSMCAAVLMLCLISLLTDLTENVLVTYSSAIIHSFTTRTSLEKCFVSLVTMTLHRHSNLSWYRHTFQICHFMSADIKKNEMKMTFWVHWKPTTAWQDFWRLARWAWWTIQREMKNCFNFVFRQQRNILRSLDYCALFISSSSQTLFSIDESLQLCCSYYSIADYLHAII